MRHEFTDVLWYWRGLAPWYFVSVPALLVEQLHELSGRLSYGWGMIPAEVRVGRTTFATALWPKDGGYIVPIKADVRRREHLAEGEPVTVELTFAV
ncbi:hypothetical protein FHX74_001483 [Friedmanniella endophytica]|uniref:DUF1905 domain-containing protein n=1 Tax=Microlunatus kandeliicorticis TaxID=1759536 RepID=A0A7W3IRK5_9ACTN|nr:DUF1905 domain-containing protein [Microlunatus kandeliicorticis]MBA8793878.1 hypothetical protein [Microlunatus kandeliicorticis]